MDGGIRRVAGLILRAPLTRRNRRELLYCLLVGRMDRRLRDRAAWRGVWYSLIKLPVAFAQLYTVVLTVFGVVDITYPVDWLLFRNHAPGSQLSPLDVTVPLSFGRTYKVYNW